VGEQRVYVHLAGARPDRWSAPDLRLRTLTVERLRLSDAPIHLQRTPLASTGATWRCAAGASEPVARHWSATKRDPAVRWHRAGAEHRGPLSAGVDGLHDLLAAVLDELSEQTVRLRHHRRGGWSLLYE